MIGDFVDVFQQFLGKMSQNIEVDGRRINKTYHDSLLDEMSKNPAKYADLMEEFNII